MFRNIIFVTAASFFVLQVCFADDHNLPDIFVVKNAETINDLDFSSSPSRTESVQCSNGAVATGGGYQAIPWEGASTTPRLRMLENRPIMIEGSDTPAGWVVRVGEPVRNNNVPYNEAWALMVYVICAKATTIPVLKKPEISIPDQKYSE